MRNKVLENSIKTLDDYILGNGGLYNSAVIHDAWNHVKAYIEAKDKLDTKNNKERLNEKE